jgi:hypothetical protein
MRPCYLVQRGRLGKHDLKPCVTQHRSNVAPPQPSLIIHSHHQNPSRSPLQMPAISPQNLCPAERSMANGYTENTPSTFVRQAAHTKFTNLHAHPGCLRANLSLDVRSHFSGKPRAQMQAQLDSEPGTHVVDREADAGCSYNGAAMVRILPSDGSAEWRESVWIRSFP